MAGADAGVRLERRGLRRTHVDVRAPSACCRGSLSEPGRAGCRAPARRRSPSLSRHVMAPNWEGADRFEEVLMALTFELAAFTVRQEDEAALVAGRAEMIQALQRA